MTPPHRRLFFRKKYTLMYAHHEHGSGMSSHATNPKCGYGDGRQGHKIDLRKGRTKFMNGRDAMRRDYSHEVLK